MSTADLARAYGVDPDGPAFKDITYHGALVGIPGHPQVALIASDGEYLGVLPHVVVDSPAGLAWGYRGDGARGLARSLLLHALGRAGKCQTCRGTREVHWSADGVVPRMSEHGDDWGDCIDCDRNGDQPLPYRSFLERYPVRWPQGEEWQLSRSEILAWASTHGISL